MIRVTVRTGAVPERIAAAEALAAGAEVLAQSMRDNAPVQSGALIAAIAVKPEDEKSVTVGIRESDWGGKDFYPAFVEFGHGGKQPAPPHPYLRPAVETGGAEVLAAIAAALMGGLSG